MIISPVYSLRVRREFDFNSIPGLVVDLDARDLQAGNITRWGSRVNGHVLTGSAVCTSLINGRPSVSFYGTNLLTSSAVATQLSGSKVITAIGAYTDNFTPAAGGYILGTKSSGATGIEWLLWTWGSTGDINNYVQNVPAGNSTQFHINNTLATPIVLTVNSDLTVPNETALFRVNGTSGASTQDANTNTLTSYDSGIIFIGGTPAGGSYWTSGSLSKLLIYATDTKMSDYDLLNIERAVGSITGITF